MQLRRRPAAETPWHPGWAWPPPHTTLPHPHPVPAGTRLLLLAVCGVVLAMPPGVTLVAQAALLALTANNTAYCSTQVGVDQPVDQPWALSRPWKMERRAGPKMRRPEVASCHACCRCLLPPATLQPPAC